MLREKKQKQVERFAEIFRKPGVYLADFTGIDVPEMGKLRRRMRNEGVQFLVVKNTLARRAAKKAGLTQLEEYLVKPTGLIYSEEDAVNPARIINAFHKETGKLSIKCGLLEGKIYDAERVTREIALLPPRSELQWTLAVTLNANLMGLAFAMNGILTQFVRIIGALRDHREGASPTAPEKKSSE